MKFTPSIIIVTIYLGGTFSLLKDSDESFPRVVTSLGAIEGYYKISSGGKRYEAYEGIPYAQPPTGELRFGVARSVAPWMGVLMAKQFSPGCMQYRFVTNDPSHKVQGSEDCLYLNIYTPVGGDDRRGVNGEPIDLLPVILYIHGGAFQFGNANNYKSKHLLDRNVTFVTINYRLGSLGFLSTENEIVSGNMGLKDQVIAMRWVKDNIRYFGGDPSKITIFGQSAGATSVHYHYLTNLTTGLFQRGISLSGTALSSWAQIKNSLERAKELATAVGCPPENVRIMVDCLRARPAHQIIEATEKIIMWLSSPAVPFGPVIEKGGGEFTFIDRSPVEIINSSRVHDVPWITGIVSGEGLCVVAALATNATLLQELNDNWERIAPYLLDFDYTIPKIDHARVARSIKEHYLGTSPISRSTLNQTIQIVGDRYFDHAAEEAARLQARANRSPVRLYYFSYRGAHSFSERLSGSSENFGVTHGDDEGYILESVLDPTTTPQDRNMQKEMIDLLVSFASEGTPNVGIEWPPVSRSEEELSYLHIAGPGKISMKAPFSFGESSFWRSLKLHENGNCMEGNTRNVSSAYSAKTKKQQASE